MKERERKILEAAGAVLRQTGSEFSLRKVADSITISLGNLQYYFKTKSDLLNRLLEYYIDLYEESFETFLSENVLTGREAIESAVRKLLEMEIIDEDEIYQIFTALIGMGSLTEDIEEKYYTRVYALIIRFFKENIPDAADTSIQKCASLLFPFINSYSQMHMYLDPSPEDMAGVLTDSLCQILMLE